MASISSLIIQQFTNFWISPSYWKHSHNLSTPFSYPNLSTYWSSLTSQHHLSISKIKSSGRLYFFILCDFPSNSWLFLLKQLILVSQLLIMICHTSPEVITAVSTISRSLIHELGTNWHLILVTHSSPFPLLTCLSSSDLNPYLFGTSLGTITMANRGTIHWDNIFFPIIQAFNLNTRGLSLRCLSSFYISTRRFSLDECLSCLSLHTSAINNFIV